MIKYSIVLVPFPFDDFSSTKVKPALCLTSEIGEFGHVIIAFISSKAPEFKLESDIEMMVGTHEWSGTGLLVDSVIRLHGKAPDLQVMVNGFPKHQVLIGLTRMIWCP